MGAQPKPIGIPRVKEDHPSPVLAQPKEWEKSANDLVQKMQAVTADIQSYDTDEIPATSYARDAVRNVIVATAQWTRIPMGSVAPLDGGIQIGWRFAGRHLRLFCGADASKGSYIYKATGSGAQRVSELLDAQAVTLAQCLGWMQSAK
jgi:hypothetical protein